MVVAAPGPLLTPPPSDSQFKQLRQQSASIFLARIARSLCPTRRSTVQHHTNMSVGPKKDNRICHHTTVTNFGPTGPHHTSSIAYPASEGRHRYVVGGQSRARVHSAALQYQAHGQVLQHTDSVSAVDINWWRARELMAPLFAGDEDEIQGLIRDHMILPYLFGDFRPSHIQEYAGGLLLTLEQPAKDGGGIRSSVAKTGVAASRTSPPTLSGFLSLVFLHLDKCSFCRLQVPRVSPPTPPRFFLTCMAHLTLTPLFPT
jgi:hypothetical protein